MTSDDTTIDDEWIEEVTIEEVTEEVTTSGQPVRLSPPVPVPPPPPPPPYRSSTQKLASPKVAVSPKPAARPKVAVSPKPAARPKVAVSPKPAARPKVAVSPKPAARPKKVATPPKVTAPPKKVTAPQKVAARPKVAAPQKVAVPKKVADKKPVKDALGNLVADIDAELRTTYAAATANAQAPSSPQVSHATAEQRERYIAFALGQATYAAPVANISEVLQLQRITRIPNVPEWVLGVANLRGEIVSVVDLRSFLGISCAPTGRAQSAVVSRTRDDSVSICLVVDALAGMRMVDPSQVLPPPSLADTQVTQFLQGVVETDAGMLSLFNLDNLLRCPAMDFSGSPR